MTDDNNSTIKLTRRRILGGALGVGLAAAGAGAGTFALFSDQEQSNNNTVQAGTLDLEIEGSASGTGAFTVSGLEPGAPGSTSGASVFSGAITLTNSGSISANHVELAFGSTVSEASEASNGGDTASTSATGMETLIEITTLDYGTTDLLASVSDANSNGIVDLDDVATAGVFDDLSAPAANGGTTDITIAGNFVSTDASGYTGTLEDDDFQGDITEIIVDAALAQEASQNIL